MIALADERTPESLVPLTSYVQNLSGLRGRHCGFRLQEKSVSRVCAAQ
jgi:hypothetical protein